MSTAVARGRFRGVHEGRAPPLLDAESAPGSGVLNLM